MMKNMKGRMGISALRNEPNYIEGPFFGVFPGP
jgi:hypothetical protein